MISLLVSALYYDLPNGEDDPTNMTDQNNYTGFFFFESIAVIMLALLPMVLTFPPERAVFLKEENGKYYSIFSYFVGRTVLELPVQIIFPFIVSIITFYMVNMTQTTEVFFKYFLLNILLSLNGNSLGLLVGSAFSDPKIAISMSSPFIMFFMLFAGFFANRDSLWEGVSWIEYISPFKYGLDGHVYNNFEVSYFKPNPIENLNLNIGYWNSCYSLIGLFIGFRLLAFLLLIILKRKL